MRSENPMRPVISANIREARELAKMSRQELADAAGCTAQAIHTYETGKADPSLPMLAAIAKVTGQEWGWFTEDRSKAVETVKVSMPKSEWEQFRQFKKLVGAMAAGGEENPGQPLNLRDHMEAMIKLGAAQAPRGRVRTAPQALASASGL